MIVIQGYIKISPKSVARFREAAAALVAATRQEAGCIAYAFAEDLDEPGLIHVIERWADESAISAHNKTAHLAAFMAVVPTLAPSGIRIARYDTAGEKLLLGA